MPAHEILDVFRYTPGRGRAQWMAWFADLAERRGLRLHHREKLTSTGTTAAELERMARFLFGAERLREYRAHGDAVITPGNLRRLTRPVSFVRHIYARVRRPLLIQVDFGYRNDLHNLGAWTWLGTDLLLTGGSVWTWGESPRDVMAVHDEIARRILPRRDSTRRKCWSCGRRFPGSLSDDYCASCAGGR